MFVTTNDATVLTDGTDLNTLSDGDYRTLSNNSAGTMKHCPTAISFNLRVVDIYYRTQFLTLYNNRGISYTRIYMPEHSSWTIWRRFTDTETGTNILDKS